MLEKHCPTCKKTKGLNEFSRDCTTRLKVRSRCRNCEKFIRVADYRKNRLNRIKSSTEWKLRNPEKARQQLKNYRRALKLNVVSGYGGKCECCGESHIEFLTIDHVKGGGCKMRRDKKYNPHGFYREVIEAGFPKDFRVLCMNCNFAVRFNNPCPHKALKLAEGEA